MQPETPEEAQAKWKRKQKLHYNQLLRVLGMVRIGLFLCALGFVWFGIFDFAIPELRAFVAEVHRLRG